MTQYRTCQKCALRRNETRFSGPRGTTCDTCRKATARASARKKHLKDKFNITPEQYDAIIAAQHGKCVCGGARSYNLHVDHDHALEKAGTPIEECVRGGLCKRCNKTLRDVRDSPQILRALADYLENPPAQGVLHAIDPTPGGEASGEVQAA